MNIIAKLEAALGNEDQFSAVMVEIKKLSAKDAIKACKDFKMGRATSKRNAIERIAFRHESLIGGRLRLEATGNRTAA